MIAAEALHLEDFFLLLRWGSAGRCSVDKFSAGRCSVDEFVEEEDAKDPELVPKFVISDVESDIVNNCFQVRNARPRPQGICSQEAQLAMGVGGGLGELLLLSLFMAEVGRIGGRHGDDGRIGIGGCLLGVVCVRFGGKFEG